MATAQVEKGISLEVLGTCVTNTTPGSTHDAKVEYKHLWSYAQQAALIAVSEKSPVDQCYRLIADPERRAKRIAAHYADLYFRSAEKSNNKVQFYWPALAAFVVKDIVEAFRFTRDEVLNREWKDMASLARNSTVADIGSVIMTDESPYAHALRTYAALAKGNLWLFMDIYPWLWFFLEYGINADGTLNRERLAACLPERSWSTFQPASKQAVEELPFGPHWMARLAQRLAADPVYKKAGSLFNTVPSWTTDGGYGGYTASALSAHSYCRTNVKSYDNGYRMPCSQYWGKFKEAYFVMESEHKELGRIIKDRKSLEILVVLRDFRVKPAVEKFYKSLLGEHSSTQSEKSGFQRKELAAIAEHEQVNVLQPLIYDDVGLKDTMDANHQFSRLTRGWLSPKFQVTYSASPAVQSPDLKTVFDEPDTLIAQFIGDRKSLPDKEDRMDFVAKIAKDFDRLMTRNRSYMDAELRKITGWLDA